MVVIITAIENSQKKEPPPNVNALLNDYICVLRILKNKWVVSFIW